VGETSKDRYTLEEIAKFVPLTHGNKSATDPDRSGAPDNGYEPRVKRRRGRPGLKYLHFFWMYASLRLPQPIHRHLRPHLCRTGFTLGRGQVPEGRYPCDSLTLTMFSQQP